MNITRIGLAIIFFILTSAVTVGCGKLPVDYSAQIANAQKPVPFKIIVPTYLPPEMQNYPISISPPSKGTLSSGSTLIGIIFAHGSSAKRILIYEENSWGNQNPLSQEFVYWDIGGINILEEKTTAASAFSSNMSGMIDSYHYVWNQNNLHIKAVITGASKTESRKAVESMIQP